MSSPKYKIILSDEAREDFRDILSFTIQMWGEQQADIYASIINDALILLANNIMSVYMPIIKLTQRRKDAKNLRIFYYGRATGHHIIQE
jgi:plasmid stabilization system protein ParE